MTVLAVAAISARMMAEAAARDGFDVVALDLFGDADTRRAAAAFVAIGEPGSLHIDAARVLAALRGLAARGDVMGWVAGSGFEGRPELLAQASLVLPLIGTAPGDVRRVRDPALFFAFLAAQGIGHPKVQSAPPAKPSGWHTTQIPLDTDLVRINDSHACRPEACCFLLLVTANLGRVRTTMAAKKKATKKKATKKKATKKKATRKTAARK